MTKFEFAPGGGLTGLPIGSPRESVRTFFGGGYRPFRRTSEGNLADYWAEAGVFAYYDAADLLEALEFSSPSDPVLNGCNLLSASFAEAIQRLRSWDAELDREENGAISRRLGLGIWCEAGDGDGPAMSLITFGPGYYD